MQLALLAGNGDSALFGFRDKKKSVVGRLIWMYIDGPSPELERNIKVSIGENGLLGVGLSYDFAQTSYVARRMISSYRIVA